MIIIIQNQFINKILASKDPTLITLNNLTDEFFSDYKDEFNYIKNHLQRYGNIPDEATFLNIFPDFDIIPVNESNKYLLDSLYDDRNKRLLAKTFNKVREALNDGDTEKAMRIYNESSEMLLQAKHLEAVDIYKDLSRYDSYVERSTDFTKYYVKTGFPELDEVIGGWDRKEELATIVARPNVGKSFVLFKVALAAAEQGLTVGIYSGEMSETKVGYRLDTIMSHISNTKIIHGNTNIQVEYKKFLEGIQGKLKGKILVLTPSMINGTAGVNALRAFIDKYHLDMLCIDQHSLLEDDRKAKNPVERAANISRDLKNLQVMVKIPIIAVSQQNRENTDEKGVDTKNVAQSDRISQDSTILLFLERGPVKENKHNIMTLTLVKSRDSANGCKLSYVVDLDRGTWAFLPDEEDGLKGNKCEELKNEFEDNGNSNTYEDEPF